MAAALATTLAPAAMDIGSALGNILTASANRKHEEKMAKMQSETQLKIQQTDIASQEKMQQLELERQKMEAELEDARARHSNSSPS